MKKEGKVDFVNLNDLSREQLLKAMIEMSLECQGRDVKEAPTYVQAYKDYNPYFIKKEKKNDK